MKFCIPDHVICSTNSISIIIVSISGGIIIGKLPMPHAKQDTTKPPSDLDIVALISGALGVAP
jgi:hypothetical protein